MTDKGHRHTVIRQSARYVGIGTIASTVDGSIYFLLTRAAQFPLILANFASVNVGITVSFFLNAFLNFRKTDSLRARALSFYGACYFGMLVSTCILAFGTSVLGFPDVPVKVASVLTAGVFQFLFNRLVTFGRI